MNTDSTEINQRIVSELENLSRLIRLAQVEEGKKHKLSPLQVQILKYLIEEPEEKRSLTSLARSFNLSKATLSESVNNLYSKNLITKRKQKIDLRGQVISLSPKGKNWLIQLNQLSRSFQVSVQMLDTEEKHQFLTCLLKLIYPMGGQGLFSKSDQTGLI